MLKKAKHSINMGIHKRLQGLKRDADAWPMILNKVIHTYNYGTVSTAHIMTPYDATDCSNKAQEWLSIYRKSMQHNMYDVIQACDQARVKLTQISFAKTHEPKFATELYIVMHVGEDGCYLINKPDHKRVWWRHDLQLSVEA